MKRIKTSGELPSSIHWAAIVFKTHSIYHEGDERSRTHPGHGYPAYTEAIHAVEYITFDTKGEMEQWVIKAGSDKLDYRLISAQPISAKISATVSFL